MTFLWIGAGNSKVLEPNGKKEPSNNVVLDLGIDNVPLAVDLRERVWVCDVGFNKFDIYSGVGLFNVLYVNCCCCFVVLRPRYM